MFEQLENKWQEVLAFRIKSQCKQKIIDYNVRETYIIKQITKYDFPSIYRVNIAKICYFSFFEKNNLFCLTS